MSDELVTVRDRKTGETLQVGAAWVQRWPDDFEVLGDAAVTSAPSSSATPQQTQQPQQQQSRF